MIGSLIWVGNTLIDSHVFDSILSATIAAIIVIAIVVVARG